MPFEIVTNQRIHEIVLPTINSHLEPLGFECVAPLRWVRDKFIPIRHTFELQQWKGGSIAPRFGLSLDFVPHISGSSVKWHRTNKSARPDLIFDTHNKTFEFSIHKGEAEIVENSPSALKKSIQFGNEFWELSSRELDLLNTYEKVRRVYDEGLSEGKSRFNMYPQHQLSIAFIYARQGDFEKAIGDLDAYISRSQIKSKVADKLRGLLLCEKTPGK